MRIFFAFMVLGSAVLTGCYDMHGRDGIEPPHVPMGDAGPMPIGDAGEMPEPDGGPMVEPDADVPSDLVLVVDPFYSGWRTPPARQDMGTADIRVTALRDVEWDGGLWFQISTETPGCMVRGSLGTEYFRDLKVRNTDTGETMMGPVSIPSTEPPGSIATGFFRIGAGDARLITAGTTLRFAVTTDLAAVEDAPGEFMGCSYAVHTGAGTIIDPSAVRLVGGERLRPDQIGGDNVASYSGFTVDVEPVMPDICDAVDVPADGSGRVIVRVEGGGDMTVPPDTDFVAFSVIIENHMLDSVAATVILREASLSADCTVERPSISFTNECDASNAFRPSSGSCGAGPCFTNCGENGPVLASGTSTRFTMFGHTRASGLFVIDMGSSSPWIWFNDAAGVRLPSERVVGNIGPAPVATITVP